MQRKLIGKRIQQYRIQKKITQEKMSKDLGHTENFIFNLEKGYCFPSMASFFAICEYFDITPAEFFSFE